MMLLRRLSLLVLLLFAVRMLWLRLLSMRRVLIRFRLSSLVSLRLLRLRLLRAVLISLTVSLLLLSRFLLRTVILLLVSMLRRLVRSLVILLRLPFLTVLFLVSSFPGTSTVYGFGTYGDAGFASTCALPKLVLCGVVSSALP